MKILCVIDSLCLGGAQRQLVELAIGFRNQGHQVSFLTYHDIPFYGKRLEAHQIPEVCIPGKNYIHRMLAMRRYIRNNNFDAVLAFLEAAVFICEVAGLPRRRWRLVAGERSANPMIFNSIKLRMYRYFHLLADYVVANSNENIRMVRAVNPLLPWQKCRVIHNLVDVETYRIPDSFQFRKTGKIRVVVAARMEGMKNLAGLMEALGMLEETERNRIRIEWYGVGDAADGKGASLEELESRIMHAGLKDQLILYPPTHNMDVILAGCDAVGLFSTHEGLPNAICEGMAYSKPVICSAISDLPVILSHEPALLFDPRKSDSISKALRKLIGMSDVELKEAGRKNRERAQQLFRPESISGKYLLLLGK